MMPKKDGFTLAQEIRTVNSEVPIIFLTAKSLKDDIFEGFKIGADDYITKPFSMEELVFRIEAILRRVKGKKGKEITMYKLKSLLHLFRILESVFFPCFASLHYEFCEFIRDEVIPVKNVYRSFIKNRSLTTSPRIDMAQ